MPRMKPHPDVNRVQSDSDPIRHDWSLDEVRALFALPFADLILRAQRAHRAHHAPNTVQMSTLLSIKTGACPEDCAYCPQSVRYDTGLAARSLMEVAAVRECAAAARAAGATRFCMGAAYRSPKAHVRLSAGRDDMSDELQALCFLAGANSIFYGERLLTTGNPDVERDRRLFARLGLTAEGHEAGRIGT